ncbi:hypothetical protein MBLNU459_g3352t2 [Dothideomycetes sp. NU459]
MADFTSMTVRTACSSALVGLHEACLAMQRGECESAIVGGANLILAPGATAYMTEKGFLSTDGSCKTFSADANGYARGEAITAVYIKSLDAAIRDGNPIRAVIRSTATNSDGRTPGITHPSTKAQEALMRKAYEIAGIDDFSQTAFVECHGTGTAVGDPVEVNAVARVFGDSGVFIGSIKPNLGHSEGASGLSSLIKAVLALEHRTIPPNIKFSSPNPKIPFVERKLTVPVEPTPWPESQYERVSVNSFGIGGSNAHVILDSARNFGEIPTRTGTGRRSIDPQLLLLSANSATALEKTKDDFQALVSNTSGNLEDLAYTLANRREHLPHRAFMVARKDRLSVASQGRKTPSPPYNLVMVFTGQGAQWPRMGRELLMRSDLSFQSSIRSLDKYLQDAPNAPEWTLEQELLKPARTSGVQKAELSQPLCTAVQIALVDCFRSHGVEPAAVVGHSSGEIAAAYTTGALTAQESIIVAWQRGVAAKKQNRPGAMAAVGLSWDMVTSFLNEKVVVACENSPKSVTLSGDTDEVQDAVARIRKAYPDVVASMLKVDKAYHSHHMREVGTQYYSVVQQDLVGRPPQKPFFSTVTGKQESGNLDASYWQNNLESPVLFKTAVSSILDTVENVAFLEIGPHGALAGPLRQISAHASSSAPHVSAMVRGEDCVESYLTALGKLFELNIPVDLGQLFPDGFCLPDLPHYAWDHDADYWRESRIAHEWRTSKYPSHPLLGIRLLESTSLEPSWRNLLAVDDASWLRDHKVEDNIIFPCAGYIAMVGEAIRQIGGAQDGFALRHVVISSAMVMNEGSANEVITTFHPHRLTDSLDSQWWDFTIASLSGNVWTKHFTGQVSSEVGEPVQRLNTKSLPRKFEQRKYYDLSIRAGLMFGPLFQRLTNIWTGTIDSLASATITKAECGDEAHYHLHPTVVDACIQSASVAALKGCVEAKYYRRVPTKIDKVVLRRCASGADVSVAASAIFFKGTGDVVSRAQQCIVDGQVMCHMEGLKLAPLEEAGDSGSLKTTARVAWGPDIDFLDPATLIKPSIRRDLYTPSLDELNQLCMVLSHRRIQDARTEVFHLQKYQAWIARQVQVIGSSKNRAITTLDDGILLEKIESLARQMSDTPVAGCATALKKVVTNISGLFSGKTEALEFLLADDTLMQLYVATDASDRSQFIQHLAHTKPNLRVLEIGAGTGGTTASMLEYMVLPGTSRLPLYSKYTFTDISSGFFVAAKERFKDHNNIEYRPLDISKDPFEQGFDASEKYDLILATNVIHATKSLSESLNNVHKLLAPSGRLLLHELHSTSKWFNFIFGTLPGWWYGEADGRFDEPYVAPARWRQELARAGFAGLDAVVLDGEEPHQWNAIMVAKPKAVSEEVGKKAVTILYEDTEEYSGSLSRELQSRGYTVDLRRLGEELPVSQDIISLLDVNNPFFQNIDEKRLKSFQQLLEGLGQSGLLWITHPCQLDCRNPAYAQVVGAARSIRTEMLLDFATCEVDDIGFSMDKIVDVFTKFHTRAEDESLKPDFEYAINKGLVNVPRIYPFALKDELVSETHPEDQMVLSMTKPGRLTSLQWNPREPKPLNGNEVEVEIHSSGLNFKSVLEALAIVPLPEAGLGLEAGGIVSRVGPEVKDLFLGDRVMVLGEGCFSTHVVTSESLCEKIPLSLTFEDTATMPVVFMTAIYSLFNIGGLQKGQSILIHSACGGVGIAAVQLAQMIGAEVFATVGSEEKIKYLVDEYGLPANHIFSSRDASFVEGLMRETSNKGVDMVLNSLSGELLHATWRCVAEFGKMVDIGKRDFLGAGQLDMDVFLASRTYTCFYLDALMAKRPSACKELLRTVMDYFHKGHIKPIKPTTIFDASSIEDAFRHMQQGHHLGKIVISMRGEDGSVKVDTPPVKTSKRLELNNSASYLLVGGLGGLGRAVSRYLVEHNARHLVFLSRSAGTGLGDHEFFRELESMGCEVKSVKGSVTSKEDVS